MINNWNCLTDYEPDISKKIIFTLNPDVENDIYLPGIIYPASQKKEWYWKYRTIERTYW